MSAAFTLHLGEARRVVKEFSRGFVFRSRAVGKYHEGSPSARDNHDVLEACARLYDQLRLNAC